MPACNFNYTITVPIFLRKVVGNKRKKEIASPPTSTTILIKCLSLALEDEN